jgi:hypothetical protein
LKQVQINHGRPVARPKFPIPSDSHID